MGVSFKVARAGRRYRPKLPESSPTDDAAAPVPTSDGDGAGVRDADDLGGDPGVEKSEREVDSFEVSDGQTASSAHMIHCEAREASFSINLYADGFSIGKPAEGMLLPLVQDIPKLLHPYDRTAMTLFSAIENGWFPGDILDDIPCKYHNGTVICEVWDFRTCVSKTGGIDSLSDEYPNFQKVQLKMCMENVIKDMPSISSDSWTYNDLLQAESRIMKVLQPVLHLDPTPSLNRLSGSPTSKRIDLQIHHRRPRVKQQDELEVNTKCSNVPFKRDVSKNEISESFMLFNAFGDDARSCAEHAITGTKLNSHQDIWEKNLEDNLKIASRINGKQEISAPVAEIVGPSALHSQKEVRVSCLGTSSETLHGKRQSDKSQPTLKSLLKRPKFVHLELGPYQEVMGQRHTVSEQGLQWRGFQLLQQLKVDKMPCENHGETKHSQMATSHPVLEVISKTQPDVHFNENGRNTLSKGIIGSKFENHAFDAGAMMWAQCAIPGAMRNMQQGNFGKYITGHDFQMMPRQNCKQINTTSISEALTVPSSVSLSEADLRVSCPGMRTSAVSAGKRLRNHHQPALNPLLKRPKIELLDLAPHQNITGQINLQSEHGFQQNGGHSQLKIGEQPFEDVPKAQSGMHLYSDKGSVKCEVTAERVVSEKFCTPVIGNNMGDHLSDAECNVCDQGQSLPSKTSHVHWKNPGPSIDRSSETEEPHQAMKQSLYHQISAGGLSHYSESPNVGSHSNASSLQANIITVPAERNSGYSVNDSWMSLKVVGCTGNLDKVNAPVDAARPLIADLSVLPSSVTEDGNDVLNRFSQIKFFTERYALNCKKNKTCEHFARKAFQHSPQLLSELLKSNNTEGNRHIMNESCVSKNYLVESRCAQKTRTLTFRHSEILRGEDGSLFTFFKPKTKLVLCEFGEPDCKVETWIIPGDGKPPIYFALLPNAHKAGIFVNEFTSLMKREGYKLEQDQFPPAAWNVIGARNAAADCYQVSQNPFPTCDSGQMMILSANMDSHISTVSHQLCPIRSTLSPGQLLPPFYSLSRPQEMCFTHTLPNVLLHRHQTQMSILLSWNYALVRKLLTENHIFGWPALLRASSYQCEQYLQQPISWTNVGNIMRMQGHVSNLRNTGQVNASAGPFLGFQSNQLLSGGIAGREVGLRVDMNNSMNNSMKNSPDCNVMLCRTGSLIGWDLSKSGLGQSLCIGKFKMGSPMPLPVNLDTNYYNLLHNQKQCVERQTQQQIELHHQHVYSSLMAPSQQTYSVPLRYDTGVTQQQFSMNISNVDSPLSM